MVLWNTNLGCELWSRVVAWRAMMMEIANNDNFMYYIYFYYIRISMKLIHINIHISLYL